MVALSPRTCVEMGIELSEEDKRRPYVEVSGRKGLGVKADDLIDKLIEKALEEVTSRHAEEPEEARRRGGHADRDRGAALLHAEVHAQFGDRVRFQEALSFEGETGPYVQYAAVRARNILRKLEERGETLPDFGRELTREAMARQLANGRLLADAAGGVESRIRRSSARWPAASRRTWRGTRFNWRRRSATSITNSRCCPRPDREKKTFLLWMTDYFRAQLERTLDVLGIEVPEYM